MEVEGLLRAVADLLSPRAREKGLEIAWAAPAQPVYALADEGRLRQILLNFAANAIKFTVAGGVLLSAEVPGPGRLRITVEDTGPGVSKSDRDRIFEAFAQAEAAHADLGGAGLPAIARRPAPWAATSASRRQGLQLGSSKDGSSSAAFWFEATLPGLPGTSPIACWKAAPSASPANPSCAGPHGARSRLRRPSGSPRPAGGHARTGPGDVILVDASPPRRAPR